MLPLESHDYSVYHHTLHKVHRHLVKMHFNFIIPSPLQASHRPPLTLKLNLPFDNLVFWLHSFVQRHLLCHQRHPYVAGLERGVLPIGD